MKAWMRKSQMPEVFVMILAVWVSMVAVEVSILMKAQLASPRCFRIACFGVTWLLIGLRDNIRDRRLSSAAKAAAQT